LARATSSPDAAVTSRPVGFRPGWYQRDAPPGGSLDEGVQRSERERA
jgi:hypothetical protein